MSELDTQNSGVKNQSANNPSNDNDDDEISLLDLAAVIWKRKWLIIIVTALATVFSVGYAAVSMLLPPDKSYMPNVYTPKAMVLISSGSSGGLSSLLSSSGLGSLAGMAGVSAGNSNGDLAVTLATSNTMLDALNKKFDFTAKYKIKKQVVSATRAALLKKLSAKMDAKTNLLTISFTDIDPVLARDVVNETVTLLGDRFEALGMNKASEQKSLLEAKLVEVDTLVKSLEAKVKAFQSKYGVINVEALASEQISIIAQLRSELIMKEMEISNYQKVSTIDDPVMQNLKNERDSLLAKINEIETGKGSGTKIMPSQKELPTLAFEYQKLQNDLAVQVELYKILTQQYEIAKFNAAGQEPAFQILEMAEVLDKKSGPARSMTVIVAVMAGFFLSILMAFVVESFEKIRNDPEAIARFKQLSARKVR